MRARLLSELKGQGLLPGDRRRAVSHTADTANSTAPDAGTGSSEQSHQVRERPREPRLQLPIPQDQHGDQRRPDLTRHGIGRGAHNGLDLQGLLARLEEQLDLPVVLVDAGDRGGAQPAVVRQEDQDSGFSGFQTSMRRSGIGYFAAAPTPARQSV